MELNDELESVLDRKGRVVWFVGPDTSVLEAIRFMTEKDVGALLVIEGGTLFGVVSERDIARKMLPQGRSASASVRDIMSADVVVADVHCSIEEAMSLMTRQRVRHLPVVEDDTLVGLVSIGDLVEWTITEQQRLIDQLESYVMGKYSS